ncbi:MAG: putative LPS assembly protein LptD [bacterium]
MAYYLKNIFLFFFILSGALCLLSQDKQTSIPDTVVTDSLNITVQSDSLGSDSLQIDTTKTKPNVKTPIEYEAEKIYNSIDKKQTILSGNAKITYQDIILRAALITVEWDKNIMHAQGVEDSVWIVDKETGDSTKTKKLVGLPEFSEAGDVMNGEIMDFNFKTKKGRVIKGRTEFESGFYHGNTLKMAKPKLLYISDAKFTTCDLDDPHFHFWAKKMRIDVNKKVIAKPLVMYIGNIPVAGLPFLYFPIRKGRKSGFIIPRYGESSLQGRYLSGFGYYWAASEYWDIKSTVDYFEKSGFILKGQLNYNLRYKLRGSVSGSWTRKDFDLSGTKERRWNLNINHSQTISPTLSLNINGSFVSSGNLYKDLSSNRNLRLKNTIRSNATLRKKLSGSKNLTINLNQTRNLTSGETEETLPRISFRGGTSPVFKRPEEQKEIKWYHNIIFSYSSEAQSKKKKVLQSDSTFTTTRDMGWDHNINISSPQKIFTYLTWSPNIRYDETWYGKQKEYFLDPETNTIDFREKEGFYSLRTFNFSSSFGTKLYGTFNPFFLKNTAFRHVVTPNLSYNYRPDFADEQWGYYQTVMDSLGEKQKYDRFSGGMYGSTPTGEQRSLSLNIRNLFQMKTGKPDSTKKFDLFRWNLSTSYNWKAKQFPLNDIRSSINANPLRNLNVSVNTTYTFYKTDSAGNKIESMYIDDIEWKKPLNIFSTQLLRQTRFNFNINLKLQGKLGSGQNKTKKNQKLTPETTEQAQNTEPDFITDDQYEQNNQISNFDIPWTLNVSLRYSHSKTNPLNSHKTFYMNTNLNFNLTENWKITYNARYNFEEKEMISQDFVFYRDLHCWEARFVWSPIGRYKHFYFKINVKASMLSDIKYEKGTGRRALSSPQFLNY